VPTVGPLFPRRPDRRPPADSAHRVRPPDHPLFLPARRRRPWASLATSAGVHGVVIFLALLLTRQGGKAIEEEKTERGPTEQREHVMPLYVPPPPRPVTPPSAPPPPPPKAQPPPALPVAPPPAVRQPKPEPEANAPPEEKPSSGAEEPDENKTGDKAPKEAARATAPPRDISTAPTMESEARRIFGRRREGPPPGAGPRDVRPLETELPDRPDKCVPRPAVAAESAAAPQIGVAVGRIFRGDNGRPLAGAHLVMLGTAYTAFTDENGEYQFRFDLSLIDNCRTQYVRVTADGYESRLLVLVVGPRTRSDDVTLRRKRW
jgi:hypothetical protein